MPYSAHLGPELLLVAVQRFREAADENDQGADAAVAKIFADIEQRGGGLALVDRAEITDHHVAAFGGFAHAQNPFSDARLAGAADGRGIRHQPAFSRRTHEPGRAGDLVGDERRHHDDGAAEQQERRQRQPAHPVQRRPFMHEDIDPAAHQAREHEHHQRQQQQSFPRHQGHAENDLIGRGDLAEHGGKIAPAARDREHRAAIVRIVVLQRADQKPREQLDAAFFLARRQQEQATLRAPAG